MSLTFSGLIRFEEYEVDRSCWQLSWHGEPLPLNRKTFDLLLYLVDRRDRVVSKDELLQGLWPGQFVEESNLTQHVFLLRKALSRHESGRKMIETIPGRGYRFNATVESLPIADELAIGITESITRIKIEEEISATEVSSRSPITLFGERGRVLRFGLLGLLGLLAFAVLLSCGLFLHGRFLKRVGAPTEGTLGSASPARQAIAVLGFHNSSSRPEDEWLSTAVGEMLASEMTAGDNLRVIPNEDVARAESDLNMKGHPIDSDPKRTSLSHATGADILVRGSYVVVGPGATPAIRLMVQAQDAHSGKQLASISRTGSLADLFQLVDQAGVELRSDLSKTSSKTEAEEALSGMSHNVAALRLYAEGLDRQRDFDSHSARSLFERAVQADPDFAMAHLGLADAWSDLGFMERAGKESAEAYKLSNHLPRAERLAVEADYRKLSNDSEHAISLYRALSTFYPDDATWGLKLAAEQSEDGRQRDAIDTLEPLRKLPLTPAETVELDGLEAGAYAHVDQALANDKARALLDEATAIADKQGGLSIHGRAFRYKCFALSHIGPVPVAQSACEQAKSAFQAIGNLQAVANAVNNLGVLAQQVGDWKQGEADYEEARRLYHQLGSLEKEVDEIQNLALLDLSRGELARALQEATELSHVTGTADDYHTAYEGYHYATVALLLSGRLQEAKVAALKAQQSADKEHSWDFKVYQQARSRDLRGWIAFRSGDLDEAQALFHEALTLVEPTHDDVGEAIFTTDQASVVLERGHPEKDVVDGVRHAATVLSKLQDVSDQSIEAEITLAELDLQTGATVEASQAIATAGKLDNAGASLDTHLEFLLGEAELQQSQGHINDAKRVLQEEVSLAKAKGYAYLELSGEIALAKLDAKAGPSAENARRLQILGQEAKHAGFKGLAHKALLA
jgi:DNA-binding winged helix-turn-helix (wHTH) protein/tetratricopeptide (TPR) repeat protein